MRARPELSLRQQRPPPPNKMARNQTRPERASRAAAAAAAATLRGPITRAMARRMAASPALTSAPQHQAPAPQQAAAPTRGVQLDIPMIITQPLIKRVRCRPNTRMSKLFTRMREMHPGMDVTLWFNGRLLVEDERTTVKDVGAVVEDEREGAQVSGSFMCCLQPLAEAV